MCIMETIKIDEDGKYVLVVENAGHVPLEQLNRIGKYLNEWWKEETKFFILDVTEGVKVRFERLEKDEA